jgi:antitoxin ChpS
MQDRYGRNLRGVYLFGSRARGDAKPFSDVDLAIVVSDSARGGAEVADLSGIAYEVFLQTGAEIQPWVFSTSEWEHPTEAAEAVLLRSILHDARPIWVST